MIRAFNSLKARFLQRFGQVGESIVETLAAVLICSLALLMMYTAVASASRMNDQANRSAQAFRENVLAAELQDVDSAENTSIEEVSISGFDQTYEVRFFGSSDTGYCSYRML